MHIYSQFFVDIVDKLVCEEIFPDFYNISGSHSYQQVSGRIIFFQKGFDFFKRRKIIACRTKLLYFVLKRPGADPQIVGLAGCINISQHDVVCQGKCLGKFR